MSPRSSILTGTTRHRLLLVWILVILALAGLGLGIAGRVAAPGRELAAAEGALGRHDLVAARFHVDRCLARWPSDERALLVAARVARRSDDCAGAERLLTASEQSMGPTDASRLEWALLGAQQGDFAAEEKVLQSAVIGKHPATPVILEALAKGYNIAYRWPEAIQVLNALIDRSPGHAPALRLRGMIVGRLRGTRGDEAVEKDLRGGVELAPEWAPAHAALGDLLNRFGQTREAIHHYELAIRIQPADPATLLGLARAFTDSADLAEAERRLDELLAAHPAHADGLVERGRLALRRSRPAEAEPFLARAIHAAAAHRDAHQLYLLVLKELGRSEAAARCEARLAELRVEDALGGRLKLRARDTPGAVEVRWELWLWSLRNGEVEEGIAWLAEILRIAPRHAQAHMALADYFDQVGQPRRAALHRVAAEGR